MAKGMDIEKLLPWAIIVIVIVMLGKGGTTTTITPPPPSNNNGNGNTGIDLCKLVESEVKFTGQRMFLAGTALTSDYVRVLQVNGDGTTKDKGQFSMNSGTTSTAPNKEYKLYFGENSTTYYAQPLPYTAPCDDATDDKSGTLCTIDTTPTITVLDEYGRPQAEGGTNNQVIAASEPEDLVIRVKVSADECYGNPYAGDKKNAVCVKYVTNTSGYKSLSADSGVQDTPYAISANNATAGYAIDCFKLNLLKDAGFQDVKLHIVPDDNFVYHPSSSNLSIFLNDVDLDLDADTLAEIWNFEDEDNNELGATVNSGTKIYITS